MKADHQLILEAIITTEMPDGSMHVAPMGPEVDDSFQEWVLKPFQSSTTFQNLRNTNRCIVHVVDDSMLIANAVLGMANHYPSQQVAECGFVLSAACHWYALSVVDWNTSDSRAIAQCSVVQSGILKPFFGWNRAKHAVVEMAILASRVHLLDRGMLNAEIERYRVLVSKTAGSQEREAFQHLENYIQQSEGTQNG
jgi:hypothetical protein